MTFFTSPSSQELTSSFIICKYSASPVLAPARGFGFANPNRAWGEVDGFYRILTIILHFPMSFLSGTKTKTSLHKTAKGSMGKRACCMSIQQKLGKRLCQEWLALIIVWTNLVRPGLPNPSRPPDLAIVRLSSRRSPAGAGGRNDDQCRSGLCLGCSSTTADRLPAAAGNPCPWSGLCLGCSSTTADRCVCRTGFSWEYDRKRFLRRR